MISHITEFLNITQDMSLFSGKVDFGLINFQLEFNFGFGQRNYKFKC